MIEVKNLIKYYGPTLAIKDISFHIEKGEVLGFLGPNGAGKTTTMKILTCFMPATSGSVKISGFDVFEDSMKVKRLIGYLPEIPPLYTDMPVIKFLEFVARLKGVSSRDTNRAVNYVMDRCYLQEVKNRLIGNLSKGFKQRVGIAHALIHNPSVLILDEPTIGLDPKQIIEIRQLIKELAETHTIILSSHILPEVTMICKRVVIINEGKMLAEDTIDNLSTKLRKTEKISVRLKTLPEYLEDSILKINGIVNIRRDNSNNGSDIMYIIESEPGLDVRDEVAKVIVNNNCGLLELKQIRMTLEDVFLKLIMEEGEGSLQ